MANDYYGDFYQQNKDISDLEIDREFDGQSYRRLKAALGPVFALLYHPKVYGSEYIPTSGPVLLAGNHRHVFDPLFVCTSTDRVVHFMAKIELHEAFYGRFFQWAQTIPVNRRQKDERSMQTAIRLLEREKVIGIMPEGKVNRSNVPLLPLKYGTVAMAKKTSALIVPFGIKGSYKPFRYDMSISFGMPINIMNMELSEANALLYQKIWELIED